MLSSGLRILGQRGLAASASRGYSTIVGVPLAEQEDYFRKIAWKVMNEIPEGDSIRDHWPFDALSRKHVPGVEDYFEIETAWTEQDPKDFLLNSTVDANDFTRDPRRIHSEIADTIDNYSNENPAPALIGESGVAGVQYRKDADPATAINWDFYAKHFPEENIADFKGLYDQLLKDSAVQEERMAAENEKMRNRLVNVFAWAMADHQQEAKKIAAELEATEAKIEMVNQAGFELETQTYEEFVEKNPDFVEELDIQLIEGNWCVEEEDLPKNVPVKGYDWSINYPLKSKEEMNDFWLEFNKKLDAAVYGGSV